MQSNELEKYSLEFSMSLLIRNCPTQALRTLRRTPTEDIPMENPLIGDTLTEDPLVEDVMIEQSKRGGIEGLGTSLLLHERSSIRGPGGTTIHHIVQASSPRLSISEPGGLAGNCGGAQHAGMQAALRGHRQALR